MQESLIKDSSEVMIGRSNLQLVRGVIALLVAVLIYGGNFVISRFSLHEGLSPFDLVALRYLVAGGLMLPVVLRQDFRTLGGIGWRRGIVLVVLAGAPYMLLNFEGLRFAPSSHGAALNAGFVPVVIAFGLAIWASVKIKLTRLIALMVIISGIVLLTSFSIIHDRQVFYGDILLLAAGVSWGLFTILIRSWELNPLTVAAVVSVLSLFIYVPAYFFYLGQGLTNVSLEHIVVQGFNQGVLNAILGLYLFAYGVKVLGPQRASLFNPLVPVCSTLLAISFLGEVPTVIQCFGIGLVACGMWLAAK